MKLSPKLMSDRDLAVEVGQGNPGALNVSVRLLQSGQRATVERLAELNIVGPRVWLSYKDCGDETLETLVANVANSAKLIESLTALGYAP